MTNIALKTVNFHNQELITLEQDGVAYVSAKPICENMGLSWRTQRKKITNNSRWEHMTLPLQTEGGEQELVCMPLIKLNGWLFSINPSKVREDLREKVIQYQEECFVVLYNYWNEGAAINPRMNLTEEQKGHIIDVMRRRVAKKGTSFQAEWSVLNRRFGVATYKDIKAEHYPLVCEYLGVKPLEGEYIPRDPKQSMDLNIPMADGRYLMVLKDGKINTSLDISGYSVVHGETYRKMRRWLRKFADAMGVLDGEQSPAVLDEEPLNDIDLLH